MRLGSDRNKKNETPLDEADTRESTVQPTAQDERLGQRTGHEEFGTPDQPHPGIETPVGDRPQDRATRETERIDRRDIRHEDRGDVGHDRAANSANPAAAVGDSATPHRDGTGAHTQDAPRATETEGPLIAEAEIERLRIQWREVQGLFVDSPQDAVTRADELVDGAIRQLTEVYANRKHTLESRWSGSGSADTEDLRQALRGYRSFFDQLLSTGR